MIRVDVWLPDPAGALSAGAFGVGALIRIERADLDLTPPFPLGSYAEVHTLPILATTLQYQWWDADGIATSSYRFRVSNAGDTIESPYSDPFAGTNPAGSVLPRSYASLDRVIALFETRPNVSRLQRLAQALGTATDELIAECGGRDYFRHPAAGSADWSPAPWDIDGDVLHVHDGIAALDDLTIDGTAVTEYALRGSGPREALSAGENEPPFHIELSTIGARFPADPSRIVLTGARGWPVIHDALAEAAAARARQLVYGSASYSGSVPGPDEYNASPMGMSERWPQVFYRFREREKHRFTACLFANVAGAR
jgi:hypothetical protein